MNPRLNASLRYAAVATVTAIVGTVAATPAYAADGNVKVVNTETVQVYTSPTGQIQTRRVYEQLAMTGNGSVDLKNPISTDHLRNLDGFGGFEVKNGEQVTRTKVEGEKKLRSVSDYKGKLPLAVSVSYLLDGKNVKPGDVVGKDGKLEVQYTVENVTGTPQEVSFPDGKGGTVTKTVNVPIPMVGSLSTVAPPNFTNVKSQQANIAGDGKGGTKLSFTMTLFPPIGSTTAVFGYTADVKDGVVPRAEISALPVNPLESPTFKTAATSYKGGADTGAELTDGAGQIDANLLKLRDGASTLLAGLIKLRDGAGELNAGLAGEAVPGSQKLANGAGDLADGLGKLNSGSKRLADGTGEALAGSKKLNAGAGKLDSGGRDLGGGVDQAVQGGHDLADGQQRPGGEDFEDQHDAWLTRLPAARGGLRLQTDRQTTRFSVPRRRIGLRRRGPHPRRTERPTGRHPTGCQQPVRPARGSQVAARGAHVDGLGDPGAILGATQIAGGLGAMLSTARPTRASRSQRGAWTRSMPRSLTRWPLLARSKRWLERSPRQGLLRRHRGSDNLGDVRRHDRRDHHAGRLRRLHGHDRLASGSRCPANGGLDRVSLADSATPG